MLLRRSSVEPRLLTGTAESVSVVLTRTQGTAHTKSMVTPISHTCVKVNDLTDKQDLSMWMFDGAAGGCDLCLKLSLRPHDNHSASHVRHPNIPFSYLSVYSP